MTNPGMNAGLHPIPSMELYHEIQQFYIREAWLLDRKRYDEWLGLLTEDVVYRMPIRITREKEEGPDVIEEMAYFEENRESLELRIRRLATSSAWTEIPAQRTRRLISNVNVESGPADGRVEVSSAFLLLRSRAEDEQVEHIFGERKDVLRRTPSGWKLSARTIVPDQTVLTVKNLSMFL
jgi:3-phenylpropionate/cinnamic acid dioxygenase small subunit